VVVSENSVFMFRGERRWYHWTNRAIFDEQGNLAEIQVVGRDITERKEYEARLATLNECFLAFGPDPGNPAADGYAAAANAASRCTRLDEGCCTLAGWGSMVSW
jgi:hypothetical protein